VITFLASPKAFKDIADFNQRNAIQSWLAIHPDVEVILYGDSPGTDTVCEEYNLLYVPDIEANSSGIPFFGAIAEHARVHAKYDTQVYLNCDILMTSSVIEAAKSVGLPQFLMVGQRIDLGEGVRFDLCDKGWKNELAELVKQNRVELHWPSGMDYFVFTRGMWAKLPPLVIGRAVYDSALMAYCFRQRIPIIDATFAVIALHQFHDYGHITGGRNEVFLGKEALDNRNLHNLTYSVPNTADTEWQLRHGKLVQSAARGDKLRALELHFRFIERRETLGRAARLLWRILNAIGLRKTKQYTLDEVLKEALAGKDRLE